MRTYRPLLAFALTLSLFATACAGTTRQYSRVGTAGAILFLGATATTSVGLHGVSRRDETAGRVMVGVGATAQATALLMMIYALDGLMQQPPSPGPAQWAWEPPGLGTEGGRQP